jgi:hypothetical protein
MAMNGVPLITLPKITSKVALKTLTTTAVVLSILFSVTGCGGGGGGSSSGGSQGANVQTISGTLINSSTNLPISGATVEVAQSTLTTTTNSQGQFSLPNVPAGPVTIDFVYQGNPIGDQVLTVGGVPVNIGSVNLTTGGNPPPPPPV